MFDVDAYLGRLSLPRDATLEQIHREHVVAIPFENLDPHRGVPVSLDPQALQDKLVTGRRGGYCFEHNLLLKAALEALGVRVEPMLARVRWGSPAGTTRPLTHLVLRVERDGELWHADVGYGNGTLLEPIPFGAGGPYEQAGWRFRVVEESDELVLQTESREEWRDVYAFSPQPVPQIDIELGNWFSCTHPSSRFVTGLMVARQHRDGTRVTLTDWIEQLSLISSTATSRHVTAVEPGQIPGLLVEHFGLDGFGVNEAGRVVLAGRP
jgi:N-hydroxyarylamine O-acetyltransferase